MRRAGYFQKKEMYKTHYHVQLVSKNGQSTKLERSFKKTTLTGQ